VVEIELVTQRIVLESRGLGVADGFAVGFESANKVFPSRPAAAASGIVNNGFRPFSGSSDAVPALAPPVLRIAVHGIRPGVRSPDLLKPRGPKECTLVVRGAAAEAGGEEACDCRAARAEIGVVHICYRIPRMKRAMAKWMRDSEVGKGDFVENLRRVLVVPNWRSVLVVPNWMRDSKVGKGEFVENLRRVVVVQYA